jgi:ELWxxDGT repeat protein
VYPTLLKDINPGASSSYPHSFTDVQGTTFFIAADSSGDAQLWKSDGTGPGTVSLYAFPPGGTLAQPPGWLTDVNGTLFFEASDAIHGTELWKSDGTPGGTIMVKDIQPGFNGSFVSFLTALNGDVCFSADDGTHGQELWRSDGTEAGTVMVKDINPGSAGSGPAYLTNVGGTLYFSADDGTDGQELWKSDGTEAGTVMVKDINPGTAGSFPTVLTGVGNSLFFRANDGTHGNELWKSNGTPAGTVMVKDINPGPADSILLNLSGPIMADVNGTLFFTATDGTSGQELWKSDGTEAGTVSLGDLNPGPASSQPNDLTAVGNTLFFAATDGGPGSELWKSDGTPAGTVIVKDVGSPSDLTALNGTLYFSGVDAAHGTELWRSDGTAAGTFLVKDINPGFHPSGGLNMLAPNDSNPSQMAAAGGGLFFSATDPLHGTEPWVLEPGAAPAAGEVVTGADFGSAPEVKVFDPVTGAVRLEFYAYDSRFLGGVRVAMADMNSDGIPDIITAPGPSGGPDIRVFDGQTGTLLQEFMAYDPRFLGGVFVAAGFVNLDGIPDIITGADAGGGPEVRIFSGADDSVIRSFMAYDPAFRGGVRVAAGDTSGAGLADIITAAGPGGGPHVEVFRAQTGQLVQSFYAYDSAFLGGVYVMAGDVSGDGKADIITGAGAGGGPHVKVFNGADGSLLRSFYAYAPHFTGGVRVGATTDLNGGPYADIVTAAGPDGGPHVKIFDGATLAVLDSFYAYDPKFRGGVYVGGS